MKYLQNNCLLIKISKNDKLIRIFQLLAKSINLKYIYNLLRMKNYTLIRVQFRTKIKISNEILIIERRLFK